MVFQPIAPLSNVTPFTYRDGATYLEILHGLRKYLADLEALVQQGIIDVGNAAIIAANAATEAANAVATMIAVNDAAIEAVLKGAIDNLTNVELAKRNPWKRPKNYHVKGDGATDDTVELQNCLNAGSTLFDATTYYVNGTLTFPSAFSQMGLGPNSTKFKLGPNGKIVIGSQMEPTSAMGGSPNGRTVGFSVDGSNAATNGLICGNYGGRIHEDIAIENCTKKPLLVDSTQNSTFTNVKVSGGEQSLILDHGAGGNVFNNCDFFGYTQFCVDFRNTGTIVGIQDVGYAYSQAYGCTDNTFNECKFELPQASAIGIVNHRAGLYNRFNNCGFDAVGLGTSTTFVPVLIGELNTALSVGLRFDQCQFLGAGGANARAAVFSANSGASLYSKTFVTNCFASGFKNIFIGHNTDIFIRNNNEMVTDGGGREWIPQPGSNALFYKVLQGADPTEFYPIGALGNGWSATADVAVRARRVNDSIELQGQVKCVNGVSNTLGSVVVSGLPIPNAAQRNVYLGNGMCVDPAVATGESFYSILDYQGVLTMATTKNNVPANTLIHLDGVTYPYVD